MMCYLIITKHHLIIVMRKAPWLSIYCAAERTREEKLQPHENVIAAVKNDAEKRLLFDYGFSLVFLTSLFHQ